MVTKEYSLENHTVQVCDLSTDEIAKSNNWIGANQVILIFIKIHKNCISVNCINEKLNGNN